MRKLIFILIALISFSQAQTIQYIGGPTTTVISRGNFRADSIFYLPKRTKTPTDTAAFRYQISDSSLYYWTGYQWTKVQSASSFASVDTLAISTRAYRQKGDDSLGAIIATKGSGTVTSVATGYGLSGGTITTTGTLIADTALVASRLRLGKVADSLSLVKQNVITNPVTGTGTLAYIPKFTGTSTIGNSIISDVGSQVLINTTSTGGGYTLRVNGTAETTGNTFLGSGGGKVLMNYSSASPAELRIHNTAADNQQLILSNDGTYHTGFIASQVANVLSDTYAWGMFGGNNTYLTGTAYAVGIALGSSVPHFQVTRHNNLNGGVTQNLMRITSAGEVFINTTTDAGAYTLQNNGALYNTGGAILAATSGGVTMGSTATSLSELDIYGTTSLAFTGFRAQQLIYSTEAYNTTPNASIGFVNKFTSGGGYGTLGSISVGKENTTDGNASGYMSFYTYGPSALTEKLRINSSGESLFGTTTDAGNYRVQVSGNAYISGILNIGDVGSEYINVTADQNSSVSTRIRNNNTGSSAYAMVGVNASGNSWGFRMGSSAANNNALEIVSNAFGTPVSRLNITTDGIVAIATTSPSASAQLDVSSTTRGFLPPRMTTTQRDAISSPAAGLVIYNTTTSKLQVYTTSWTDLH